MINSILRATSIHNSRDPWIRHNNALQDWHSEILQYVNPHLENNSKVIDIGSGDGNLLFNLAKDNISSTFIGCEINSELAQFAQLNNSLKNVSIIHERAEEVKTLPDSLNIILCLFTVMYLQNPVLALSRLKNSLKKGGKLIITTWGDENNYLDCITDAFDWDKDLKYDINANPKKFTDKIVWKEFTDELNYHKDICAEFKMNLIWKGEVFSLVSFILETNPAIRQLLNQQSSKSKENKLKTLRFNLQKFKKRDKFLFPVDVKLAVFTK